MYYLKIWIYLMYVGLDYFSLFFVVLFLPYYILLDNIDIAVVDVEVVWHS